MNRILMLWPDITEGIPSIIRHYYTDIVTVDNLYIKTTKKQRIIRKFLSCAGLSTKFFLEVGRRGLENMILLSFMQMLLIEPFPRHYEEWIIRGELYIGIGILYQIV